MNSNAYISPVMLDIAGQMFNDRCVKEIFRAQDKLLARRSLKTVFERLAHTSVMKLNSQAMDKVVPASTCVRVCRHTGWGMFLLHGV